MASPKYRHELKYVVSNGQMAILQARINGLIPKDSNSLENGLYNICSLYFDDYYNKCFFENENGIDPREKFRIRMYNHSTDKLSLELKRKERGKTLKQSVPLTVEQTELLMNGKTISNVEGQPPLLQKFILQMHQKMLKPVIIVEYDRYPYVCNVGNVRITFDTNISSASSIGDYLHPIYKKRPVMPMGMQLMEVKYDDYLPDYIYRALQLDNLQQVAYSKYYLCRKYSI